MAISKTFSILFWIDSSRAENDQAELYVRISVNGKRVNLSLKRKAPMDQWDARTKHLKSNSPWLRLALNNKVSGGKVLSSKVPKGSNRLKIALRNAANAIGNLTDSTPLRDFFHRVNFRKGRVSAISATARKFAVIIWNMVVKGVPYINPEGYLFLDQKRKMGLVKRIQKQIDKFGLTNKDIGFLNT